MAQQAKRMMNDGVACQLPVIQYNTAMLEQLTKLIEYVGPEPR
jgi:hypothetical protein